MRKILMRAAIMLAGIIIMAGSVNSQNTHSYIIINETGMAITKFYISLDGSGKWSENLLKKDKVKSGDEFSFTKPVDQANCWYDIKYLGENGKEYTTKNVRMCTEANITLIPVERRPSVTD